MIYLDKGKYYINADYGFAGVVNRNSGDYSVNCSGTSAALNQGSALTVDGDINLDGIVDIYDLVLISKNLGKTKAASTDWDGKYNLDNSDNSYVIDIKDIAKAASDYNK